MDGYEIVSSVISLLSLLGVGTFVKYAIDDRREKKKQSSKEAVEAKKKEQAETIKNAVEEAVTPIKVEMEKLHSLDDVQRTALQAMLRDRLYQLNTKCVKQHFTTLEDRTNFENMYQSYHALGKNGVMTDTHDRFFEIPTEEEFKAKKKK